MKKIRAFAFAGAFGLTAISHALIIITPGPGNFPGDENLLFNQPGLTASGPIVQGMTNQTRFVVDLYDAYEDLITPPGGQARVEAEDGNLRDMKIRLHKSGGTFGTLIWNVNAAANGTVTFTVQHLGADHVESFDLKRAGENFFRFEASAGDGMTVVQLHTDVDVQNVKQIRIGGAGVVPEPGTAAAVACGLAGLLLMRRKK